MKNKLAQIRTEYEKAENLFEDVKQKLVSYAEIYDPIEILQAKFEKRDAFVLLTPEKDISGWVFFGWYIFYCTLASLSYVPFALFQNLFGLLLSFALLTLEILCVVTYFKTKKRDKYNKLKQLKKQYSNELIVRKQKMDEAIDAYNKQLENAVKVADELECYIPEAFRSTQGLDTLIYYIFERGAETLSEAVKIFYQDNTNQQLMAHMQAQVKTQQQLAKGVNNLYSLELWKEIGKGINKTFS